MDYSLLNKESFLVWEVRELSPQSDLNIELGNNVLKKYSCEDDGSAPRDATVR